MAQALSRMLTMTAVGLGASLLSIAACTHTTDRVLEPVGAGDASAPTPEVSDAGLNPLTPIALPPPAAEDYRLVRAPELGLALDVSKASFNANEASAAPAIGGAGGMGSGGMAGTDQRPVASGGSYY
jgi:hypothetical protein